MDFKRFRDIAVIETYTVERGERLACFISVFGAEHDRGVSRDDLPAWRKLTSGLFRLRKFPGNQSFIRSQFQKVAPAVLDDSLAPADDTQGATPC